MSSERNRKILQQLEAKIGELSTKLKADKKLPAAAKTALDYLEDINEDPEDTLADFQKDFETAFGFWQDVEYNPEVDVEIAAVVLEWSGAVAAPYDADAGAYGYGSVSFNEEDATPRLNKPTFDYCGSVYLSPFDGYIEALESGDEIYDIDGLADLYRYTSLKYLHEACAAAVKSESYRGVSKKPVVRFFANEHDDDPYLFFVADLSLVD